MIQIGLNPNIVQFGGFVLSWHGLFTVVAVALAVYLVGRWAPYYRVHPDAVYSTAIWCIVAGIIGARAVHVIDQWDFYSQRPDQIIAIWNGGIALWGGLLAGLAGGVVYARLNGLPIGRLADLTAPALLLAQAVGRIGDIINGEHCAKLTSLPWGFVYTHPNSPAVACYGTTPTPPSHPAVVYEMLWDLALFAVLWWGLRGRLRPEGMLFVAYLALFSFGRFFILFFHTYKEWLPGLNQAQIISLVVLAVTVPLLAYRARLVPRQEPAPVGEPRRRRGSPRP